jgi:hypothetical protein
VQLWARKAKRVFKLTNEGFADGRCESGHEEEDGHDERAHVLGCLCESVFETRNRSKDLAESDEDVSRRTRSVELVRKPRILKSKTVPTYAPV